MHYLSNKNEKHIEYNLYLSQLKIDNTPLTFLKRGKLVVCLIEFRPLREIEHVLAAVMKIYKPSEIGISIMYGNLNKDYVIIFAWEHSSKILSNHKKFIENGGKFINIFPKLEIISK